MKPITTIATLVFTGMLAMTAQAATSQSGDTQSHAKQDSDKASTYDRNSPLISNGTEGPENGGTKQDKSATNK